MSASSPSVACEDNRLYDLLAEYLRQVDSGASVDQTAFIAAHPEFAASLAEYFAGVSELERMAGPPLGKFRQDDSAGNLVDSETSGSFLTGATFAKRQDVTDPFEAPLPETGPMPETFGRYQILKELGQGAMGAVYLARDTQLDRKVALKIPKFTGPEGADLLERFYREARAAAVLRHPNICPVHDVGEIAGQHYITMAFIEGRPLRDFARSKRLQPERHVASVIRKIALGLAEAHACGIIHRDLKPANIMVDKKGEPVVMDFGLARRDETSDRHVTRSGAILGTPAYMSPEQVEGNQSKIGPAADIYSLGVVMYELLTGQVPFDGTLMSILMQIASTEPKPPSSLRPGLNPRLEAICLRMMAKQPGDRYGSMIEVAQALADYLKNSDAAADAGPIESRAARPARPPKLPTGSASSASASALLLPVARRIDDSISDASVAVPASLTLAPGAAPAARTPPGVSSGAPTQGSMPTESLADAQFTYGSALQPTSLAARLRHQRPGAAPWVWVALSGSAAAIVLLFATITLYLRVGSVDLKVVVNDPSLAVKFAGETVTFEGSGKLIRVKPGERKFVVEHNGVEAETDKFVVKERGQNVLEVSLVDGQVVVAKDGRQTLARSDPPTHPADPVPQAIPPISPSSAAPAVLKLTLFATLPSEFVFTTAVSPDGKLIAGGNAGVTRVWNATDGSHVVDLKLGGKVTPHTLAFSPDSRYLAWGGWGNEEIRLYDARSGELVRTMRGNTGMVRTLCFSADGTRLLSGSQGRKFGQGYQFTHGPNTRVWNVETGEELHKFVGDSASVGGFWLADGRRAVSRSGGASLVRMWDTETGKEELVYGRDLPDVGNVALSPNQKYVAASLKNSVVLVWETATGKQLQRFEPAGFPTFTRDGERLFCSSSQGASFRLFDVRSGAELARVEDKLPDGVGAIQMFAREDRVLVSTYSSGHVYIIPLSGASAGSTAGSSTPQTTVATTPAPKPIDSKGSKDAPPPAVAPFNAAEAKAHQDAWAAYLNVPAVFENSIGMKLAVIPPGEFLMGRRQDEDAILPKNGLYREPDATRHKVTLTRPFLLGATEVTQKQWRDVMGTEPWRGKSGATGDDYPATYTSKSGAAEFCRRLGQKENASYRLPTEAEWEFACRAGTETIYFFGEARSPLEEYACNRSLSRVASKKPNPWNLYDMYGNLWEWVADGPAPHPTEAVVDPLVKPGDSMSVIRGSCFRSAIPREYSSGARHTWPGSLATDEKGFRVVREAGLVSSQGSGTR